MPLRHGLEHVVADAALVNRIGRGGNIQDDRTSLPDQFGDRITFIETLRPEILIVPDVFANGDPQGFTPEQESVLRVRRLEVTRFVEDIVGRQQHLALLEEQFSVANHRGGIRDRLSGIVLRFTDISHDYRDRNDTGEAL